MKYSATETVFSARYEMRPKKYLTIESVTCEVRDEAEEILYN
jgi:hypothetical protein